MPTPFDSRIQQQRQRIKRNKGDDSNLRDRLTKLKVRRYEHKQANRPPTPQPWSGQYETTVGQLNRDHQFNEGNLAAEGLNVERQFGFNDQSDPFSRARQLQENFQMANRGTGNNYAASGQLYAGSLNNARAIDRKNFDQSWDSAQKEYQGQIQSLAQRRLESQRERDEGILAAEAQRLEDSLSERVDPAEAPPKPKFVKQFYKQQRKKQNRPRQQNNRQRQNRPRQKPKRRKK